MLSFTACNPIYVSRAAWQEAKILMARQDIQKILNKPEIDQDTALKLKLTLQAREFAKSLGLKTDKAYSTYSDIGREDLTWVVMGARPYAFEMATWWFPIVGSVPYRGFFSESEANDFSKKLVNQDYETWVRPSSAFSTLGWFNDPLLSTTLRYPAYVVINTVLHELFHNNIWVKDNVVWNESAANFFAQQATVAFFKQQLLQCQSETCSETLKKELAAAQTALQAELQLAQVISQLYLALNSLYQDKDKTRAQILMEREQVFEANSQEFRKLFPNSRALLILNNAELMALKTYLTGFDEFNEQFAKCNNQLECFLSTLRKKSSD